MDEVHFQQHGSRCRMWIPPDTADPVLLHHPTRRSVGYFGAVRLRDGKMVYRRETSRFNAETCFVFLRQLWALSTRSNRRVVVITDNVRYHHAALHKDWREAAALWFRLEYLPAYSPDLNPIERAWKLTRRLATHNRYFPELDDVINAVEHIFESWRKGSEVLRRLCAII
jgi:transposase